MTRVPRTRGHHNRTRPWNTGVRPGRASAGPSPQRFHGNGQVLHPRGSRRFQLAFCGINRGKRRAQQWIYPPSPHLRRLTSVIFPTLSDWADHNTAQPPVPSKHTGSVEWVPCYMCSDRSEAVVMRIGILLTHCDSGNERRSTHYILKLQDILSIDY